MNMRNENKRQKNTATTTICALQTSSGVIKTKGKPPPSPSWWWVAVTVTTTGQFFGPLLAWTKPETLILPSPVHGGQVAEAAYGCKSLPRTCNVLLGQQTAGTKAWTGTFINELYIYLLAATGCCRLAEFHETISLFLTSRASRMAHNKSNKQPDQQPPVAK